MNRYKLIAPWILLATYLPLVVLSSLHVHHETADIIDDCVQCAGHIETPHHHECDCQYCHFLSLSYLGQDTEPSTLTLPYTDNRPVEIAERAKIRQLGVSQLRAPPFC